MKKHLMYRHLLLVAFSLLLAWPAAAIDLPARKPGLWQLTMKAEPAGSPSQPTISEQCVDAATDKELNAWGSNMSREMCSKENIQKVGEKIVADWTCKFGEMNITTHAEYSGSFDSAYTVNTTSIITGEPASANGKSNMTTEVKWMGPCKPDQNPGDMIVPFNGRLEKINIHDLLKGMPAKN